MTSCTFHEFSWSVKRFLWTHAGTSYGFRNDDHVLTQLWYWNTGCQWAKLRACCSCEFIYMADICSHNLAASADQGTQCQWHDMIPPKARWCKYTFQNSSCKCSATSVDLEHHHNLANLTANLRYPASTAKGKRPTACDLLQALVLLCNIRSAHPKDRAYHGQPFAQPVEVPHVGLARPRTSTRTFTHWPCATSSCSPRGIRSSNRSLSWLSDPTGWLLGFAGSIVLTIMFQWLEVPWTVNTSMLVWRIIKYSRTWTRVIISPAFSRDLRPKQSGTVRTSIRHLSAIHHPPWSNLLTFCWNSKLQLNTEKTRNR